MRILYTLLLLIASSSTIAQAPFEGKIRYTVAAYEKDGNGEIIIYFGKPGIRLEMTEAKRPDKKQDIIIFNFDSGSIITLRPGNVYQTKPLKKKLPISLPAAKQIAGFQTIPVSMEEMPKEWGGLFGSSILYPASDLAYQIPETYSNNPELLMINKGRIVLGGDFFFPNYPSDDWPVDKSKDSATVPQKLLSVTANEVIRQPLDPSLFVAPSDYTKETFDYYTDSTLVDTATIYTDTAANYPVKPSSKKNKKPMKKGSTKTKQQAIRRKND